MKNRLLLLLVVSVTMSGSLCGQDEGAADGPLIESEGPAQLLERGRSAFVGNDFAVAEEALEKFIVDYGEADEAKEAARLHRPLVAIAKVGLKKFEEALEWIDESLKDSKIDPSLRDELMFWRAICLMTTGELVEAQRGFGRYWADESHQPFKRYEALLLFATLYIQQEFPAEAADFLEEQLPKFRDLAPEAASRAVVLQLYARLQAEQYEKALELIEAEFPNLPEMTQVISFQTLALKLGSNFLEKKQWYEAIRCLQRIWPREKLLKYQAAKISEIDDRIAVLQQRPNTQGAIFQLQAILKRVNRELEGFEAIEHFDSALRLRLAMAFQGLGRYREAALIMSEMLETMPADSVVESATLAQLQCWMEIKRWPQAVEVADRYEDVFGAEGKYLPTVLFLKAEALREMTDYGAAQLAYGKVVERFPEDAFAPKAMFMQGFLYLQQDDNEGALYQFDQVKRQYPNSSMVEDSDYWTGMAYSFSGLYEEARNHLTGYLERFETAKYRKESIFRIAVCAFSLAEYERALSLLNEFNKAYPGDPLTDESNLLMGDAYLGEGLMDEGFAAYERVRPESGRFFEDAWFKKGNAYKLLEEFETMRTHFQGFVENYPASSRLPEAVYWIGWTWLREEEFREAQKVYWETVEKYGNDPEMITITDVFSALPKVYEPEGEEGERNLMTRLQLMKTKASASKETVLAARAGWTRSVIMSRENEMAERSELIGIHQWINPRETAPRISVSVGEALLAADIPDAAESLLVEVRRWHPRTVEKGRIYRALARIAVGRGDREKAVEYFEKFEREAFASVELGEVKLEKAELLDEAGRESESRNELEAILELSGITAEIKATAMTRLGDSFAASNEHEKAIVFYERVYVAYGKFKKLNAEAYWARGQSLEKLDLLKEALETYEELSSQEELSRFDEAKDAERRIEALRPLFPEETTESQEVSS
ncbi:MAG: tetratricopeptide repeat protein [Verrucomicrobiales bacterium]|nr:tetratricopeptide repeat protein [Verrucomicrobiales bacterium]